MKGMTLRAMTEVCNGIYHGDENKLELEVTDITTDSRKVSLGSLFIAIKGARSDGHDYIQACFDNGALCCIAEQEMPSVSGSYIQVQSTLQALKDLAEYYRGQLDIKVVGITGSVGKTSTKETISSVLSTKYRVLKTLGNFNNEIGLPLTIFRLRDEDEVAVLEMGISNFGEMTRLAKIARPDIVVITNIGLCHLENLGTRDGILKAKTEIFDYMNPDGVAILNGDDDKLSTVLSVHGKKPVHFGVKSKDGFFADNIVNMGLEGTSFEIHGDAFCDGVENFKVHMPVPGEHMVLNSLAAAAVGAQLSLTSEEISQGIENMQTIAGRNNIIKENGFLIIDDCYNANPVSMKASIDVLSTAVGRKVCILGDMFELGTDEVELHRSVGDYIRTKNIDICITVGKLATNIAIGVNGVDCADDADSTDGAGRRAQIYSFATKEELSEKLNTIIRKGDNILVKASHGMHFEEIVEMLKTL